jgi:RNA polymerase sigma-70 factor (ECF subfamily)
MAGTAREEFAQDFTLQTDPFRRELLAHCYRMLGSVHDAEDLLQETLLRAWQAYDRYDPGRASLRTWLHRIATNACLTALEQRNRRPLPSGLVAPGEDPEMPLIRGEEVPWLQPMPDAKLGDPAGALFARNSLRLAFIAALQFLPAKQRAVLILREVLDWPAADVAAALDTTVPAVNSALQRARARLVEVGLAEEEIDEPAEVGDRELVERYLVAFENADLAALEKLLTDDVVLEMPPFVNWYVGRERYLRFLARVYTLRGTAWRMVPTGANGQPALAAYVRAADGGYTLRNLHVFTVGLTGISRNTVFQDDEVFDHFRLPRVIPADQKG